MHAAVVTSAAKAAYDTAVRCLRPAGTLAVVGLPAEPLAFQALALVGSEVRIVSAAVARATTCGDARAGGRGQAALPHRGVPLGAVNDVFDRMQRGAINGRWCCAAAESRRMGPPHAPLSDSLYSISCAAAGLPSSPSGAPMSKAFASQADLQEKKVTFTKLSDKAYAYTAEGDPNTGVIVGDDAVMVIDTQATPVMAQDVIRRIREVTDKPIKYVLMSHYHAVRVLGASAYRPQEIIASQDTYDLIVERGAQDMKSEIERFPRLFRAVETIPGLTWPTITFQREMTLGWASSKSS
jgi:hypothetical protein